MKLDTDYSHGRQIDPRGVHLRHCLEGRSRGNAASPRQPGRLPVPATRAAPRTGCMVGGRL